MRREPASYWAAGGEPRGDSQHGPAATCARERSAQGSNGGAFKPKHIRAGEDPSAGEAKGRSRLQPSGVHWPKSVSHPDDRDAKRQNIEPKGFTRRLEEEGSLTQPRKIPLLKEFEALDAKVLRLEATVLKLEGNLDKDFK